LASNLDNLGIVLRRLGELAAARDYHQRALAIFEARLGPDHPDVATSLGNLGNVLRRLGGLAAARDYYQRTLAIFEARVGSGNPLTTTLRTELARVPPASGQPPEHPARDR